MLTIAAEEFKPIRRQAIVFIRLGFERRLAHAGGYAIGHD
jgi:hypothetical protein